MMGEDSSANPDCLKRVIDLTEQMLNLTLANLAVSQAERYSLLGNTDDLQRAIDLQEQALNLIDPKSEDRSALLANLAVSLKERYRLLGNQDDLKRAIDLQEQVLNRTDSKSRNRPTWLANLAVSLKERYSLLGNTDDLQRAIDLQKQVLNLTNPKSQDRPAWLANLAISLNERYSLLGNTDDLQRAIDLQKQALNLIDPKSQDRSTLLANLAVSLKERYSLLGNQDDLERAIDLQKQALNRTDSKSRNRPTRLANLAVSLKERYRLLGNTDDLQRAIDLQELVLNLTNPKSQDWPAWLANLAVSLNERYSLLGNTDDLDRALDLTLEALALTHPRSPSYFIMMRNLRKILRLQDHHAVTSLHIARRVLPVVRGMVTNHPALAMDRGLNILDVALAEDDTALARDALVLACDARDIRLRMFPSTVEQEELLAEFMSTKALPGIGTQVAEAYLAHNNPLVAALALERCQASLLGRMARAHASIERLMSEPATMCAAQRYANAANRLKSLLAQIDDPKRPPSEKDIKNARDEFEAAIDGVRRADPSFLPDPIKTAEELASALPLAPALYLAAGQETGVAVLIGNNGSDMIALPGFTHAKVRQAAETVRAAHKACFDEKPTHPPRHFHATIDTTGNWLWQVVVQPLLPSLTDIRELVVVACGSVALLPPLQTAWTDTPSGGRRWLVDQLTLRYTPSLHTLRLAAKTASTNQKALAVTDPAFKGLAAATQAIAVSLFPKLLTHETKAKAVLSALSGSQAGLFFCHGQVKTNPRDTGILLPHECGILSTWDLLTKLEGELPRTILVAACSLLTVIDDGQPEEVLSLGAALNGIGIQTSLAAGWDIDPTATFLLIAQLMTAWKQNNCRPAQALAEAQNWMRTASSAEKKGVYDQLVHRKGLRDLFPWAKKAPQRDEAYFEDFHQPYYWAGFAAYG